MLISGPVLQGTPFNIDENLKRVRNQFHDAGFSHIGFSPKISGSSSQTVPKAPGRLERMLPFPFISKEPNYVTNRRRGWSSEKSYQTDSDADDSDSDHVQLPMFYGDVQDDGP